MDTLGQLPEHEAKKGVESAFPVKVCVVNTFLEIKAGFF